MDRWCREVGSAHREAAVTARVTTLKGVDAGAYYVEALPSYYLDADEPPGRWHGRGADMLGLRGEHATRTSSTGIVARFLVKPRSQIVWFSRFRLAT